LDKSRQILELITPYIKEGKILTRSYNQIQQSVNDFLVLKDNNKIFACVALRIYSQSNIGEIYSLAVAANMQKQGYSNKLLLMAIKKANSMGINKIFALSKYNKKWFINNNFIQINLDKLPKERQESFDHNRNPSIFFKDIG
jgi:N-acetylglutamate synthase-like GNAT family acetyltransferase